MDALDRNGHDAAHSDDPGRASEREREHRSCCAVVPCEILDAVRTIGTRRVRVGRQSSINTECG